MPLSIAVVVPFLNMTKQFCGQIGQVSQQINAVVMGLAGAQRVDLLDQELEADDGYVTLVNARVATPRPGSWKRPTSAPACGPGSIRTARTAP